MKNKTKKDGGNKLAEMRINNFQLAQSLEAAFNQVGHSMLNADYAAQLLAYLYIYGGGNEAVVYNTRLNSDIAIAQEKFKIKGGETPDINGVKLIKKYVKELTENENVDWLKKIRENYGIKS
jgi:hypothetical protein